MKPDEIVKWFKKPRIPLLAETEAIESVHQLHPKTMFLKTLRSKAKVLDMGAGDGTLEGFRRWLKPHRIDIEIYAYAMIKGKFFDRYMSYELGKWPECPPSFGGIHFDGVIASHFIEHLPDITEILRWIAGMLAPGGRCYLEWPSPYSESLPSRNELSSRGVDVIISNFHDDGTHVAVPQIEDVKNVLREGGLLIDEQGYIHMPFFEEELLAHFATNTRDTWAVQFAYWSKTRWAQFVIATKE